MTTTMRDGVGHELQPLVTQPEEWVRELLFGGVDGVGQTYVALPSLAQPRMVVPARRHAARGMLAAGGGDGLTDRLRRAGAALALSAGAGPLLGDVLHGPADGGLRAVLRAIVPQTESLAVRLSTLRPNSKPVVVLLAGDGRPCAYAKVGWNAVTRQLVAAEADTLVRLEWAASGSIVRVPRLFGMTEWQGLTIAVQEGLPRPRWQRSRPSPAVAAAALREIAGTSTAPQPLADGPYAHRLRQRAGCVPDLTQRAVAVQLVEELLGRHGQCRLALGRWHGDFTSWNAAAVGGRLLVWDWERSDAVVPVGLDAVHYHTRLDELVADAPRARAAAARGARPWLAGLGVNAEAAPALADLHLIELLLRHRLDGNGVDTPERRQLTAAIERELARSLEM